MAVRAARPFLNGAEFDYISRNWESGAFSQTAGPHALSLQYLEAARPGCEWKRNDTLC
jgi:hypothetical protein